MAFARHAFNSWCDDFVHDALVDRIGHHRCRRVSAHATGVGPGVAIAHALVVLAGGHWQHILAIDHHNKAGLFTFKKLFDNHAAAGIAKGVTRQHIANRVFGFLKGHGNDHAFASGQAIGLHHNRRTFFANVGQCLIDIGKIAVVCGGDLLALQEILGEGFGALQLGRALGGAEHAQAPLAEEVNNARNQRRFRANDGQTDVVVFGKLRQLFQCHYVDIDVLQIGLAGCAGIPRCYEDLFGVW